MPLDRTMQELEARLPDLRHLVADGEIVLATSESAALLADELESLLKRADTVAGRLRLLLLGGSLRGLSESANDSVAAVPTPEPQRISEPAAPVTATTNEPATWSEMDDELARIMGIEVESTGGEDEMGDSLRAPEELRRKQKPSLASQMLQGATKTEREPQKSEEKLGITAPMEVQRAHLDELQALAQQVGGRQEQIKDLWRELGIDTERTMTEAEEASRTP